MIGKLVYDFVQALKDIDTDTRLLLLRFLIRAGKAPNANLYIKERLQKIMDEDDAPQVSSPRQVQATWREVKR